MDVVLYSFGQYYGSDWIGMIFMCFSIYLLGNKSRLGFIAGIFGSIGWFIFGILTFSIPDMVAQIIVVTMHVRGFIRWKKYIVT